jgi:hypothetical protein
MGFGDFMKDFGGTLLYGQDFAYRRALGEPRGLAFQDSAIDSLYGPFAWNRYAYTDPRYAFQDQYWGFYPRFTPYPRYDSDGRYGPWGDRFPTAMDGYRRYAWDERWGDFGRREPRWRGDSGRFNPHYGALPRMERPYGFDPRFGALPRMGSYGYYHRWG